MSWNTTTASDGQHALTAVARDASGNTTTSATRTVAVRNTGLVAAYGFEETSGTAAIDSSNGFNGTISGAGRVADGRFGRGLSFDGADDLVTIADRNELDLLNTGTLEAWVRPSALASWRSVIMKEMAGGWPWALHASSDAGVPSAHLFSGAAIDALGPAPIVASTWTHLAMTWDQTALRLYVDGAEVASQPATAALTNSTGAVRIGGNSVASQFFSGLIDEVRIYNDARTAAEIAADMNAPIVP